VVFVPAVRRARQGTPLKSSQRFARRMQMIAPRRPAKGGRRLIVSKEAGRHVISHRKSQAQRTRILVASGLLVPASAVAAFAAGGGGWWEIHLVCDLSFALYVTLLLEAKHRRHERLRKVRPLATRGSGSPVAPQRLTASGLRR
jgi:hypothetical protein